MVATSYSYTRSRTPIQRANHQVRQHHPLPHRRESPLRRLHNLPQRDPRRASTGLAIRTQGLYPASSRRQRLPSLEPNLLAPLLDPAPSSSPLTPCRPRRHGRHFQALARLRPRPPRRPCLPGSVRGPLPHPQTGRYGVHAESALGQFGDRALGRSHLIARIMRQSLPETGRRMTRGASTRDCTLRRTCITSKLRVPHFAPCRAGSACRIADPDRGR